MSPRISKAAQAALDAIAAYQPLLPRGVALPAARAPVVKREREAAVSRPRAAPPTPVTPGEREDPIEPVYDEAARRNIQGNIVPGFNKDHQHFLFYRITDVSAGEDVSARISPSITSMDEVLEFVRAHRALRMKLGVTRAARARRPRGSTSHSRAAEIEKLGAGTGEQFGEQSFRQGLAERSTYLGDPTDPSHPGHRSRWRVGGPHNEADILVIVASDTTSASTAKSTTFASWPGRRAAAT